MRIAILFGLALLAGCNAKAPQSTTPTFQTWAVEEQCIDGVLYLRHAPAQTNGGFTPKYRSDGSIAACSMPGDSQVDAAEWLEQRESTRL